MWDVDLLTLALFILAATITSYLLLLLIVGALGPLRRAGLLASSGFAAPFVVAFHRLHRERRFRRLDGEIRRALGEAEHADQADSDIINAAVAAQEIDVLNKQLRLTVHRCLAVHWAVARGAGASDMSEAAGHPMSRVLRQRVIDSSELLAEKLLAYPLLLNSTPLITLQVGLKWVPVMCSACPYKSCTVAEAPAVCPTAKAMGTTSTSPTGVVDAEILTDCGPSV